MIASWMIYTIVLGGILIGAAHCLERGTHLLGRPARGIWAGALLLGLALPFLTLLRPSRAPAETQVITAALTAIPSSLAATTVTLPAFSAPAALDRALLIGWAAGSLLILGALLHGVGVLQGRRRQWHRAEVNGRVVLVAPDLGPAVIGLRRSQVVLPLWALALDPESREMILRHEEEHVRVHDPALLIAGLVAAALMPWNLALWYLHRRLRLAIELDCDARVLAGGAEVSRYGQVLLEAGACSRGNRLPALAAFAERASQLGERIDAMTRERAPRPVPKAAAALLLAGLLLVAACSFENPLGIDLTSADRPVKIRANAASTEDANFQMIRMLAGRMAEQQYPGAVARGGIPVEATMVFLFSSQGKLVTQWMHSPDADRRALLNDSPLAKLGREQIQQVEVMKGSAVGIENLGVIVVTLTPEDSARGTDRFPVLRETPVDPNARREPFLKERVRVAPQEAGPVRVIRRGDSAQVLLRDRVPLTKVQADSARRPLREVPISSLPRMVPLERVPPG